MARKRLLKSIESDFELVYVAQLCLSWEALHHQYIKVKNLDTSGVRNRRFHDNVAGEFQRFQVLLERFLEDERYEGKRVWNFVRGRFALKSLLQVPKLSGFVAEENDEEVERNVKQVLRAIEKCTEAFWVLVQTDRNQKLWWKLTTSLWSFSPVEDPRDVDLLSHLTRNLQKKEIWFKDFQGKKKCRFRKGIRPVVEESEKMEMLFTMIDMKLVSRVLQMSAVSSSQLKWCQEKLDSIHFNKGKLFRTGSCRLFPDS
ncbi:uncharacterized protein LOC110820261 [Carica papaya]|uniref:uncharacterized protein LOC110820261 n=1 Tax=Carica papaya TaxID=3649 RepID=UPI000B8C9BD7|nr:uncharacterized protein LOC110820261 [Carica papaya]XP_021905384.1 uncharacterized protein LOC110820261 [Carica papaya]XP_021905385.1 uncharacterized protein LOC110820261 [Carica papaya]